MEFRYVCRSPSSSREIKVFPFEFACAASIYLYNDLIGIVFQSFSINYGIRFLVFVDQGDKPSLIIVLIRHNIVSLSVRQFFHKSAYG